MCKSRLHDELRRVDEETYDEGITATLIEFDMFHTHIAL